MLCLGLLLSTSSQAQHKQVHQFWNDFYTAALAQDTAHLQRLCATAPHAEDLIRSILTQRYEGKEHTHTGRYAYSCSTTCLYCTPLPQTNKGDCNAIVPFIMQTTNDTSIWSPTGQDALSCCRAVANSRHLPTGKISMNGYSMTRKYSSIYKSNLSCNILSGTRNL